MLKMKKTIIILLDGAQKTDSISTSQGGFSVLILLKNLHKIKKDEINVPKNYKKNNTVDTLQKAEIQVKIIQQDLVLNCKHSYST